MAESDSTNTEQQSDDDTPVDVLRKVTNEYTAARFSTNLFSGLIDGQENDDVEFGIEIHQDGPDVALSAGTTWTPEEDPQIYSYHGLTPDEAREVADALNEAADLADGKAEAIAEERSDDSRSLIRRLMS